jgi:hypothetical protein
MAACPNCGAPLPLAPPGAVERCPFCAVETREPAPPPPPPPPPPEPPTPVTAIPPGLALGITLGAVVLVSGLVFSIVHDATRAAPAINITIPPFPSIPIPQPKVPSPTPAPSPAPAVVSLANLGSVSLRDSRPLDGPPIVGTADAFDVAQNYDWATAIGTAWSPDAKLFRVRISRIAKDGALDVSHLFRGGATESAVVYVFHAPDRKQQLEVEVNASWAHPTAGTDAGVPFVTVRTPPAESIPSDHPVPRPTCTLRQAFAALAKAGVLVPSPGYQATLLDSTGRDPWWVVSFAVTSPSGSVKGVEGVVNAATCGIVHP